MLYLRDPSWLQGTQGFQGFCFPIERRSEVQQLVGERAELLAYLTCAHSKNILIFLEKNDELSTKMTVNSPCTNKNRSFDFNMTIHIIIQGAKDGRSYSDYVLLNRGLLKGQAPTGSFAPRANYPGLLRIYMPAIDRSLSR